MERHSAASVVLAASLIARRKVGIDRDLVPWGDRSYWVVAR